MKYMTMGLFTLSLGLMACNSATAKKPTAQAAKAAHESIPISTLTKAPRRVTTVTRLNVPVKEAFAYLGNHQNLLEYSNGILGKVSVDGSGASEANGVGTKRVCETANGTDKFVETIVYFKAPYVFAYAATENTWGLTDHLATVSLKPDGKGGTLVQWDQYFNHVKPEMAPQVAMNIKGMLQGKILPYLTGKFGGEILPQG
ncbi:MAG: SRPBCC family protein [Bradymonadia bacterium]